MRRSDHAHQSALWPLVEREVPSAGTTTINVRPTEAGMKTLERLGELRVKVRYSFTPCGGTGASLVKSYTLRLR